MEDSMIDRPSMAFDEKVGNKRERDGEEEIVLGRLEKRPSGILGVGNIGVDEEGGQNGGIIDTFISNVFHKNNESVTKEECEVEEEKGDGLGVDESVWINVENGGHEGEEGAGGGGIIKGFFSNIFQRNGNDDNNGDDQAKNDLVNEVVDKNDDKLGTIDGNFENGGGELKDLNAEKLVEKHDVGSDLPSKDLKAGNKLKMKPDDYSERVFFLNNN